MYTQILIDIGYLTGIPLLWYFAGHSFTWLALGVYAVVSPLMVSVTVRMFVQRRRFFKKMAAMYMPFERMLRREEGVGWQSCHICGQKKMCVNYIDRWMCETCYVDFYRYWQTDNPYIPRWWPYKI